MSVGRLSVGAGLTAMGAIVPISPASVTVGSGSATVSGNGQINFNAVSTIDLNGIFTSTYDNYLVKIFFSASGNTVYWQGKWAGSYISAANYLRQDIFSATTTLTAGRSAGTTKMALSAPWSIASTVHADFSNPYLNTPTGVTIIENIAFGNAGGSQFQLAGGGYAANQTFDSIQISASAGTISGTIRIYGYANGA